MKKVDWAGSSKGDLKKMNEVVRSRLGYQIFRLQNDLDPDDFKPMPSVGLGVFEIRVRDENKKNVVRSFYVKKLKDKLLVLHCFIKRAQKTPKKDIDLAKKRYKEYFR